MDGWMGGLVGVELFSPWRPALLDYVWIEIKKSGSLEVTKDGKTTRVFVRPYFKISTCFLFFKMYFVSHN